VVPQREEATHVHSSEVPACRRRAINLGHGVSGTGPPGLIEASSVFAKPVGADEGISPARTWVFWDGVPIRGWGVYGGLGGRRRGKHDEGQPNEEGITCLPPVRTHPQVSSDERGIRALFAPICERRDPGKVKLFYF
jgi:hypothetical protein